MQLELQRPGGGSGAGGGVKAVIAAADSQKSGLNKPAVLTREQLTLRRSRS
jgi:hypothetical protein